jgi:trehalose 6-phosphate synthase/phosphatase
VDQQLSARRIVPVPLTAAEVRDYYDGVAREVLWPLFHSGPGLLPLRLPDFSAYARVNERFAEVAAAQYRPGDTFWVHDYHLMLVPGLLRRALPDAAIGFFVHVPFPPTEVFRALPFRGELLCGVLGADLVGFQAPSYMRHFAAAVTRVLGVAGALDGIPWRGRPVQLGVFPMGIDAEAFDEAARDPRTGAEATTLLGPERLRRLVGIDRLDSTKGIPRRLLAYEQLLRDHPELHGRVQMIQVSLRSRTSTEADQDLRAQVGGLVERINAAFATPAWLPVQYLFRSLSRRELVALYLAADVMLVTPLRDGMNLVAKEFVAARPDERGVLVLSEFTGAATELAEALHVNPYDVPGTAEALHRALTMADAERAVRMRALRRRVAGHDVHRWVRSFLAALEASAATRRGLPPPESSSEVLAAIAARARAAGRLVVLLDYDGTLVPFAPTPDLAAADVELLELLRCLGEHPHIDVHIVSGRSPETLEQWLGALPVDLWAEHGAWRRPRGTPAWEPIEVPPTPWREAVLAILDDYAARTPGALVEEKSFGLAWHYRLADPDYGASQANDLKLHLTIVLAHDPVQVLLGDKVIEVRPQAFNKGRVVGEAIRGADAGTLIVAIGDDRTDEDLFAALPPTAVAIHVGPAASAAGIRVRDVAAVRRLLRSLLVG